VRNFFMKISIIFICVVLSACGGGGGTTPIDSAPQKTKQAVKLKAISITKNDLLVQTKPQKQTVSSLFKQFIQLNLPVSTAFAATSSILPGENFGFTNKFVDGKLVGLDISLATLDGAPLQCSDQTAEARIHKVWKVGSDVDHLLVNMTLPSVINEDCTVQYTDRPVTYVVYPNGSAADTAVSGDEIVYVIEPGDQAANTSSKALLIYSSGKIRTLRITATQNVQVADLTTSNLPLRIVNPYTVNNPTAKEIFERERALLANVGKVSFNGRYLVGIAQDRKDVVLVFDSTTADAFFIVLKPTDYAFNYPGAAVFINAEGQFIWNDGRGENMRVLDIPNKTYSIWQPTKNASASYQTVGEMYGNRGRFEKWLLSDRCKLWNYETGEFQIASIGLERNVTPHESVVWSGSSHARLVGNLAVCASAIGNIFARVDVATGQTVAFNTDQLGLYFSAARTFHVTQSKAMLMDAVDGSGNARMIELNFETAQVIDHGVIKADDRQVVDLVPIGS